MAPRETNETPGIGLMLWDSFKGFAREHPWMIAASLALLAVMPLQDVMLPHLTGRMFAAAHGKSRALAPFVAVAVAIAALQSMHVASDFVDARMFPALQTYLRARMMSCVLERRDEVRLSNSGDVHGGALVAEFVKVPVTVSFWFETAKSLVPYLLVYVCAAAYFATIDLPLAGGLAAVVAVLFASLVASISRCTPISAQRDAAFNDVHENVDDTVRNLPAVLTRMCGRDEVARLVELDRRHEIETFDTALCGMTIKIWMVPIVVCYSAVLVLRCRYLSLAGRIDTGTFVSVVVVTLYLCASMLRIVAHSRAMVFNWGVLHTSAGELAACAAAARPHGGAAAVTPVAPATAPPCASDGGRRRRPPLVSLCNVHAGRALRGVTLNVEEGERVAVIGHIGSGKSTLLHVIMRLVRPDAGEVRLRGQLYDEVPIEKVRRSFGYVPQNAVLFDRTILENVLYGNPGKSAEDVGELVRRLGADGFVASLGDDGLLAQAGKNGSNLSGGQRQLVWCMRVLLGEPTALLLDEPTASMDAASRKALVSAMAKVPTVVLVTHDAAVSSAFATRTVELKDGQIVEFAESESDAAMQHA